MGLLKSAAEWIAEQALRNERRIAAFGDNPLLYHYNRNVDKRGREGFYPFTHVGTKRSAIERNIGADYDAIKQIEEALATGKSPHGEPLSDFDRQVYLDRLKNYSYRDDRAAGTIPVYINQKNVLDIGGDSGSHGAWNIADYAEEALRMIPFYRAHYQSPLRNSEGTLADFYARKETPQFLQNLSDEEILALSRGPRRRVAESAIDTASPQDLKAIKEWMNYQPNSIYSDPELSQELAFNWDTAPQVRDSIKRVLNKFDLSSPEDELIKYNRLLDVVKRNAYTAGILGTDAGKASLRALADWFNEQDITALKYKNQHEDAGSFSYMVPDPKNLRSQFANFLDMDSKDIMAALPVGAGSVAAAGLLSRWNGGQNA